MKLDSIDCRLLELLQEDAERQISALAAEVGLSTTQCWRRVQRLKEAGVIQKQVALVDARKLNLGVTVFVCLRAGAHAPDWSERFAATLQLIPEIVECHRVSGDVDYMLRIVVPDVEAYDRVYKRLTAGVQLLDVSAHIVMSTVRRSTVLPLHYAL